VNGTIQRLRAELHSDRQAFERRVHELADLRIAGARAAELAQAAVALQPNLARDFDALDALLARLAPEPA